MFIYFKNQGNLLLKIKGGKKMELTTIVEKLKELKTETDIVEIQDTIQAAIDKAEEKLGEKVVEEKKD